MRARSAYIRSFGVTGILVSASVIMLAIVSAIVAFDGWPSSASAARVESVAVHVPSDRAASEAPVIRVRPERRKPSRSPARRGAAPHGSRAPAPPRAPTAPASPGTRSTATSKSPSATGTAEAAPVESEEPVAPPAAPDPGRVAAVVTGTVQAVAGAVAGVLAPVAR
jgi:hypothetical protein